MLTKVKVCGKYEHRDGSRALINGKKPKTKKVILQKNKSKFVEDLENDNDNLEDDTDNKKVDFEEYSLEYDDAGSEDDVAGAASGSVAIQDSNTPKLPKNLESNKNNNLKSNDDDNDIATTKSSNNIPNSDEKDDLLNNYDLTTDLFSGEYQTEDSLSNSEFQTNGPPITTIFPQKHERQTKRNVVSIVCKVGIFFEKSEHFAYYKRLKSALML